MDPFPILYLLVRDDLESLNMGKGMAQAHHASTVFEKDRTLFKSSNAELYGLWAHSTIQRFGTVLVLAASKSRIEDTVLLANKLEIPCSTIIDPSYPYSDGKQMLHREELTCGYVFGDKYDPRIRFLLRGLELYK